jgi:hypothetical protein
MNPHARNRQPSDTRSLDIPLQASTEDSIQSLISAEQDGQQKMYPQSLRLAAGSSPRSSTRSAEFIGRQTIDPEPALRDMSVADCPGQVAVDTSVFTDGSRIVGKQE